MEVKDEIEVIKSIYCQPGEVEITSGISDICNGYDISLHLTHNMSSTFALEVNIVVSSQYPIRPPEVSLISQRVSTATIRSMKEKVLNLIKKSTNLPCLVEIVTLLAEKFNELTFDCVETPDIKTGISSSKTTVAMLHLDHMRAKTQYVKLIKKWTNDLGLNGRLIFYNRLILILLIGNSTDIKEYIHRIRTVNVDVDSRGQSCKERMMTVLCEEQIDNESIGLNNFEVINCEKQEDLKCIFTGDLVEIYDKYITTLSGYGLKF